MIPQLIPLSKHFSKTFSKPLSRPLFLYVNSSSVKSPEVVEFVNFYIDNAGELSKDVGYIPLPAEKYAAQKDSFKTFVESNK